jgi:hypothetical protein
MRTYGTAPGARSLYESLESMRWLPGTRYYNSKDVVRSVPFSGFAVVSLFGEEPSDGWVIGLNGLHYFFDSVHDPLDINSGSRIDVYYALPCSNPHTC